MTLERLVEAELGKLHELICQVDLLGRHDLYLALKLLDFFYCLLLLFVDEGRVALKILLLALEKVSRHSVQQVLGVYFGSVNFLDFFHV